MSTGLKVARGLLVLAVVQSVGLVPCQGGELLLDQGQRGEAEFLALSESAAVFLVEGQRRNVAYGRLVRWGRYHSEATESRTVLFDGSQIVGDILHLGADKIRLISSSLGILTVARQRVRGILFRPPLDELQRDRILDRMETFDPDTDQLELTSLDILRGPVTSGATDEVNVFGFETLEVAPTGTNQTVRVERSAVSVAFLAAQAGDLPPPAPRLLLGVADGSLLIVREIELREDRVTLTTATGVSMRFLAEQFWPLVTFLQPLGHGIQYLSNQAPTSEKQIPFFENTLPWRADRNVLGGHLRSRGDVHFKGIGMHTASRLAYTVPEKARRFVAEAALDDLTWGGGSVVFRVFVARAAEGGERWQEAFTSDTIRGDTPPVRVSVDVQDATRVALLAEFADRGDELDYLNLLEARFVP